MIASYFRRKPVFLYNDNHTTLYTTANVPMYKQLSCKMTILTCKMGQLLKVNKHFFISDQTSTINKKQIRVVVASHKIQ